MAYETILFEKADGVARLTLNRPERLNAFTLTMHAEVRHALDELERDCDIRVLLVTGAGRAFCAGQDLNERIRAPGSPPFDLAEGIEKRWAPMVRTFARLPAVVVCAVNGVAAGAGANVALASDIVVAAKSARFIQSFVNIGLMPDAGGTYNLPRLAGQARAMGLALTAEPLSAERAAEWGMIWKCVDDEQLSAEVEALVGKLAKSPPLALAAIKRAIRASSNATAEQQLDLERDLQQKLGYSEDYTEGVRAFMEKRDPVFTGR